MKHMQVIVRNPSIKKDIPNKQFIGQKSTINVENTLIFKHHNSKTYYFFGLSGQVKAEYKNKEIVIPVVITECSLKDGALFVNTDDEKEFTVYSKGPLRKLMDLAGIEDTQQFVGMEFPCVNLIGFWTIDMETLQNATS